MTWKITSESLFPDKWLVEESLFSLANGYLGVRGNFEEGLKGNHQTIRGTYINAFHDIVEIPYGEKLYGFPSTQQKIVNIMDAQTIELLFGEEEERFSLFEGEVLSYQRILHMDKGYSERMIHWRSPYEKEVIITIKRLVSFECKELFSIQVTIEPVNFFGQVRVRSVVNGSVSNYVNEQDPRVGSSHAKLLSTLEAKVEEGYALVVNETSQSKLQTACVTDYLCSNGFRLDMIGVNKVVTNVTCSLKEKLVFEKRNIFTDTLRHGEDLVGQAIQIQQNLGDETFESLLMLQKSYLNSFWQHADIVIHGDEKLQQGLRFNLYQLLQSAGRDRYSNIAAKGLSGEGYEGHYFWDTEIYMLPIFMMTKPDLARQLLLYRYSLLDAARERAKEMGHQKGALFPWRTISGQECSSYFPSGSAQYHISADIAYSFIQYMITTNDQDFVKNYGAELLFETARLWLEVGHFYEQQFRIDAVTGPDEYTCIVNNNYFTNVMAKHNLKWAVKTYDWLSKNDRDTLVKLKNQLGLSKNERILWEMAADRMYLPYDEKLGISVQDDSFLQKAVWDFENTPKDHYPLLLNYHPLTLYRYQVCKQADTVLAHFLLEDEQDFETIKNSYHYYEKITTHDSSLSSCVFSIMAAKIGEMEKAYQYFIETARMDLENTHGNTKDGLHLANMGGTWLAVVFGFAGLRIKESGISLAPKLPSQWDGYEVKFSYLNRFIHLKVMKAGTTVTVEGEPLEIVIDGEVYEIIEGKTLSVGL